MIQSRETVGWGNLCSEYPIRIVDNCTLEHFANEQDYEGGTLIDSAKKFKQNTRALGLFLRHLDEQRSIYITGPVLDEMVGSHFNYTKSIKRLNRDDVSPEERRDWLVLFRQYRDFLKVKRKLKQGFVFQGDVLEFDDVEKETYDYFAKRNAPLRLEYGLSVPDFDLLVSGATLSRRRGKTAICSNDFGILRSWKALLKKERISPKLLGFFIRQNFHEFESAVA
jgi:hypothetical protein